MATYYANTANVPYRAENSVSAKRGLQRDIRFAESIYTMTGDEESGDEIDLGLVLEAGSRVLGPDFCFTKTLSTAATAMTIHVGDDDGEGDPDRYATALSVAATGKDPFDEDPDYTLQSRSRIFATITGTLTAPVAGGQIMFQIGYLPG